MGLWVRHCLKILLRRSKQTTDIQPIFPSFVKDALSPLQVQILKKAVLDQAAGEVKAGVSDFEGANQRLW